MARPRRRYLSVTSAFGTNTMNIWPSSKHAALCHSNWERFVIWRAEASSRGLLGNWVLAGLVTAFWFSLGPDRPVAMTALMAFFWLLLFEAHMSRTLLCLLGRAAPVSEGRGEAGRIAEPNAAPNGGPATQPGNSDITEGPPSVS